MATTRDRLSEIQWLERLWSSPPGEGPGPRRRDDGGTRTGHAPRPRVGAGWATGLQGGWLVVLSVILTLQPEPADVSVPFWVEALSAGLLLGLAAAFLGLSQRRRWGFAASSAAAVAGVALGVACGATEHHLGAWPIYEMAAFGALAAISVAGWRRA